MQGIRSPAKPQSTRIASLFFPFASESTLRISTRCSLPNPMLRLQLSIYHHPTVSKMDTHLIGGIMHHQGIK